MSSPKPGRPVRGSTTGRPIMALLDLLGRRWVLRILWELRDAPLGFRSLQSRCDGMSPSVLSQRLAELRAAGIVTSSSAGDYQLTAEGRTLLLVLQPLNEWAAAWAARSGGGDADQKVREHSPA
jgi:DNA-binding HxlR family transcriptional regulator